MLKGIMKSPRAPSDPTGSPRTALVYPAIISIRCCFFSQSVFFIRAFCIGGGLYSGSGTFGESGCTMM